MPARRHLYLLRHAKSSWDEPELADRERPLAPRGRKAAKMIEAHLRRERIRPSLVLCSPARRARETLDLLALPAQIVIEPELYGASAGRLLGCLHGLGDDVESAMLIGHNPSIHDLAIGLAGGGELADRKYPTAALATLAFTGTWRALEPGSALLEAFVTPRELS